MISNIVGGNVHVISAILSNKDDSAGRSTNNTCIGKVG